jgi:hypothetical protein
MNWKVVVAGERDDGRLRIGDAHAQRRRDRPAQRAGLPGVDPVPGAVYVQELGPRDLGQADRGDVARLRAEGLVHLLVHPLRLDRDVVEVGAAQHGAPSVAAFAGPLRAVREPAGRRPLLRELDEQLQRGAGVGDDAVVGREDAPDLGRFDVDVHERAPRPVDVQAAGVPIGPAVADAQDEVGGKHRRVAMPVRGLQPGHAGHQPVVVGNRPPAHQRRDDRHTEYLRELDEQRRGVRVHDAAPATITGRSDRSSMSSTLAAWARVARGLYAGSGS